MNLTMLHIRDIGSGVHLMINENSTLIFGKMFNRCEFKVDNGKILMRHTRIGAQIGWSTEWTEIADLDKDIREEIKE